MSFDGGVTRLQDLLPFGMLTATTSSLGVESGLIRVGLHDKNDHCTRIANYASGVIIKWTITTIANHYFRF